MKKFKNKNLLIVLGFVFLLHVFGVYGLFLLDESNTMRAENLQDNWLSDMISMFGIARINITASSLFCFAIAYVCTATLALPLIFRRKITAFAQSKKKSDKIFMLLAFCAAAVICLLGWVIATTICKSRAGAGWHAGIIFLYYLIAMLCALVVIAIVYVIVRLVAQSVAESIGVGRGGASVAGGETAVAGSQKSIAEVFPGLTAIDREYAGKRPPEARKPDRTLMQLAEGFQAYLSEKCSLYYDLPMLRSFIAGMAASRLIILEGLSGTGKSSLPRYFSEYVGSKAFFAPVQSTWRDRTDVLGFYNDFSEVFKETGFLKRLYEASYQPDKFNLMVLDEMNLSRVEYYFADFLSVLEYPPEDWKISLMQYIADDSAPAKLADGAVVVPVNTWFIGTANTDDSTFTITDKVYDRAVVLDFNERNTKAITSAPSDPIQLAPKQLEQLFVEALRRKEYQLTPEDFAKFNALTQFVFATFEIQFGNRIMRQIMIFTPVYVALGGTKEEALDIMFSRKILHKVEGRFEDYIKDGLLKLQSKLAATYGAGVMASTEAMIRRLLKKLM